MDVLIVGAGLMGAQIGCEYALGGHSVALFARDADAARRRFKAGLATAQEHGLITPDEAEAADTRARAGSDLAEFARCDLAVESLPEDLDLKASLLGAVASASPRAMIATNTSSLSVSALGRLAGAAERTVGTHYWNPPLLMPLVEVIAGRETNAAVAARLIETLRGLGKRPVLVADVPGFAWNRIQMAVLREALWLVENGAASPETVDAILAQGLGRRWRHIGFFEAIALGGVETWQRAAANLLPSLSAVEEVHDLRRWTPTDVGAMAEAAVRRDAGLAGELLDERTRGEAAASGQIP